MIQSNGIITFLTDFGTSDHYMGIMKGIVLTINPEASMIDITHEIPAHNIIHASLLLANAYHYFPHGTIHIAVVDPGVGGGRKNIAIITDRYFFIGPDNGIFTNTLAKENIREIREIVNPPFIFKNISDTFHGRDVFTPCAGYLTIGKDFSGIGPVLDTFESIKYPKVDINGNSLVGEIISIDSFGNLTTNISKNIFSSFVGSSKFDIYFSTEYFTKISHHYNDVPAGKTLLLFGSSEYLEISMNGGKASLYFMTSLGSKITIRKL